MRQKSKWKTTSILVLWQEQPVVLPVRELANIINEGALRAVRMGRDKVSQTDLEESVEVILAGYQRKGAVISKEEKAIIAYHEVGHALVAALQKNSAPVHKITIIPRTSGALGYTLQIDEGRKIPYE